jgi:hypothetical protein
MPVLVSIARGAPGGGAVGDQTMSYTVTLSNAGAASLLLNSLDVSESTRSGATIGQPNYLTPNVPVGVGNPTIAAGASVSYGFQVVSGPVMPGPSPQAPGGAAPSNAAAYPLQSSVGLLATAVTSDGAVSTGGITTPVLTKDFPQSSGGALVLSQGFNLINFITLF